MTVVSEKRVDSNRSGTAQEPTVLLIAAWPKSEREDLEPDDYKSIGRIIARIQGLMDQGRIV